MKQYASKTVRVGAVQVSKDALAEALALLDSKKSKYRIAIWPDFITGSVNVGTNSEAPMQSGDYIVLFPTGCIGVMQSGVFQSLFVQTESGE